MTSSSNTGLSSEGAGLCEDCPPVGYPTDKTRCTPCPRRADPPSNTGLKSQEGGERVEAVARAICRAAMLQHSLPGMPEDVLQGYVDAAWETHVTEAREAIAVLAPEPQQGGELREALAICQRKVRGFDGLNASLKTDIHAAVLSALSKPEPLPGGQGKQGLSSARDHDLTADAAPGRSATTLVPDQVPTNKPAVK